MRNRLALVGLLLLVGDPPSEGVRAYRDGNFREAFAAFTAAEAAAGDHASPELLYDLAIAALQVRQLRIAEYTAEKLVARGGPDYADIRESLLGNVAWCRAERAAAEGDLPDPDPTAFDRAVRHARSAIGLWQGVAMRRSDLPAARRNIERASTVLAELERKKKAAEDQRRAKKEQEPGEVRDSATAQPEETEQAPVPQREPTATSLELIETQLAKLQREKRALRQSLRQARSANVERDW